MHVYDAFHAESELIPVTRLNGITNAIVAPDSADTLPGQDSFIQLDGPSATDMLLVRDIAMPLNFTGDQRRNECVGTNANSPQLAWEWPRSCARPSSTHRIISRMAADYKKKKADAEQRQRSRKPTDPPKRDLKLEALLPYLRRQEADGPGRRRGQRSGNCGPTGATNSPEDSCSTTSATRNPCSTTWPA